MPDFKEKYDTEVDKASDLDASYFIGSVKYKDGVKTDAGMSDDQLAAIVALKLGDVNPDPTVLSKLKITQIPNTLSVSISPTTGIPYTHYALIKDSVVPPIIGDIRFINETAPLSIVDFLSGYIAPETYIMYTHDGITVTQYEPDPIGDDGAGGFVIQAQYTTLPLIPNDPEIIVLPTSPTDTLSYDWDGVTYGGPGGTAGLTYELHEQSQVDQTLTRLVSNITTLPGTLGGRTPGSLHTYVLRVIYGAGATDFVDGAPQTVTFDAAPAGTAAVVQSDYTFDEVDDTTDGTAQFTVTRSIAGPAEGTVDLITSDDGHTLVAGTNYVERVERSTGITLDHTTTSAELLLADHGLVTGQHIRVSGASPAAYNGTWSVTRTDDDNLTYTMASDPASVASGAIVVHCGVVWWDASDNTDYTYKVKLIDATMDFWRTAEVHIEDGSATGGLAVDTNAQSAIFQVDGTGTTTGALQEVTLATGEKGFVLDFATGVDDWTFTAGEFSNFEVDTGETPDAIHDNNPGSSAYYTTATDLGNAPSADTQLEVGTGGRLWWPWAYARTSAGASKDSFWSTVDDVVMDDKHDINNDGSYHWNRVTNGTTLSAGVLKYSIKRREPNASIWQERIILVDDPDYDPAIDGGLSESLSAAGSGEITEDTDNVYVPFGPTPSTTVVPALLPANGATGISITQPAEAFFSGASYNPDVHGVITATALIGSTPVSIQSLVLEVRPDGLAIRIHPATVWPYSTGTAITFDIQGKMESDGAIKTIDVVDWEFTIVTSTGPTDNLFYQDNEGLLVTSDPVVVRQQLYDGYMAKSDVGVYRPLANGEIDYSTDFVNDPLGEHGKVLRCQKAGGTDSFGNVLQLRMMLERDTNYPIAARKDDVYLYFDFMLQGEGFAEWPESSKLCGLFCYDLSVGGGDVTGGGDCTSGFGARCSIAHGLDKYPFLGTLVPDGVHGSNPYGYLYWYGRNYSPTSTVYGRNSHATDPVKTTWEQQLESGQRPVGLLKNYWNSMEIRCKRNTTPGVVTGSRYEVKINGFLAVNLVDMIMWVPAVGSPGLVGDVNNWGIQEGWLQIYHGGGDYTSGSPDRLFYHFDNVTMSENPIGQITRSSPLILAP